MTASEYLDIAWMVGLLVVILYGFLRLMRDDDLNDERTHGQHRGPLGHAH